MGKGLSIAGFVVSLISLVCCFVFAWASLPLAVTGLVLSVVGGKKLKANNLPHGLATAGLVLGIIATALAGLMTACAICALAALSSL